MTDDRQITETAANQVTTKRGFPVYRTNPSVSQSKGMPTRTRRITVLGGNGAVIVDSSSGEVKGLGNMAFYWDEEVDSSRFVKLFLEGINLTDEYQDQYVDSRNMLSVYHHTGREFLAGVRYTF